MTLSAISMLILCTCCCTSQAQLNTRIPEPDSFKILLYKNEANSKQGQSRELAPVYEKPTSQEYDMSDLTSDEMQNLPHDIFHSIYESVLFPETSLDDPNSEKTQTNKVTDIIPNNSRITRQITRFGEKQQGTLQQTSSTKKLTETSSVPGSTKSKSDKPKTTSTPKQIQIGTGKTEESHVESTTIIEISETPISPTNISTSDTIAASNATTEVITSEQDTSTATLNLTSSETVITSVQTPINGSTSARTTRSESHTTTEAINIDQNASTATPNLTSSETSNTSAHGSTSVRTTRTTRSISPATTEVIQNLTSSEKSTTSVQTPINVSTSVKTTTTTRSTGPITTITSSENASTVTPNLTSSKTSNTSAQTSINVSSTRSIRSTSPITTITSSENALTVTPNLSSSETSNTSANGATSVRSTTTTGSTGTITTITNYTVAIIASVENMTETSETIIITKPSEPGPPESLKVNCDFTPSEGILDWEKPDEVNGILEAFFLSYEGSREGKRKHISDNVKIKAHNDLNDLSYSKILALWPDYNYTFRVRGKTQNVKDPGLEVEIHCFKQAALAPEVNNEKFKKSQIIADNSTAISIFINNDLFSDQNGIIINYSIIVYQQQDDKIHSNRLESLDKSLFWSDIKNADKILPYRTTPNHWNPLKNGDNSDMCCEKNQTGALCQIGCNLNCSQVVGPCNGPLRSNTHYQVFIKAYTTAGFSQTRALDFITAKLNAAKNSSNGLVIALGVSTPILIILVCVLLVMTYRKEEVNKFIYRVRHNRRISSVFATTSTEQIVIENQSSTRPVQLDAFFRHYHLMNKDSGLKFSQEFEEIKAISPSFPMVAAHLSENKQKNRWVNILPFDHSRVKILPISDDITTDYINACYIPGFNSQREYIATQGPLPATKDDFWRMVWEQSCQMIVMVTQCVERGKRKCDIYWPEDREVHYYGDLAIQLRSESILSNFTIRLFDLFMGTKTLEVKQMHFTKWQKFGCPENTSLLINFVQAVREYTPHGFIGPFVIHCSAGVGRTGTYISVDRLMQHIQQHHYVDIYGLVLEMRQFRVNMVQTEDQYIYIHTCLRDLLMGKTASDSEPLYANICKGVVNQDSQL
uniref:protein-tyrosine-phosphatase n=1 Tax=Strigamia maritima TaxID=126957 RepID=T1IVK2_STRMM